MNFVKLATLTLVLATCHVTPVSGSSQGSESGKDQALVAALSVREEAQCVDTEYKDIEASLAFTNVSAADIVIRRGDGQIVTVLGLFGTRTLRPLISSWMSMSDQGSKSDVTIHRGETFAYQFRLRLDAGVLSQPGFYKVQVNYSAFTQARPGTESNTARDIGGWTNWLIVQLRECDGSTAMRHSPENTNTL